MKVTFISSHAQLGGSERILEETIEGLGAPWIADVISLQEGPAVARFRLHHPVHVIHSGAGKVEALRSGWRVRSRLRTHPPDIVHASGVKAAFIATLATIAGGPPVVWCKTDTTFDGPLARLIARRCRVTVGISEAVLGTLGGRTDTTVIYPGVAAPPTDPQTARERLALSYSLPPNAELVSLVGRLHPTKGQEELIAVAGSLAPAHPRLIFLLIGGDDPSHPGYRARLEERVIELGLERRVLFLGYRDDVADLMAASDVLVVPSVVDPRGTGKEGFGLVAVEAMLAGTLVVAYAHGALPEVMGETGISVEPGDRSALAAAIVRALTEQNRSEMVEAARQRAARFSHERAIAALKKLYREVVAP